MHTIRHIIAAVLLLTATATWAQTEHDEARLAQKLDEFFQKYKPKKIDWDFRTTMVSCRVDNSGRRITVNAGSSLASAEFTAESIAHLYKQARKSLPRAYKDYSLAITAGGIPIENLQPASPTLQSGATNLWGKIDYDGLPWVDDVSRPYSPTLGLHNRHIALWASHGRYYDNKREEWRWQRPKLFGTTEDLFTASIVVPYLIPMLENAGATVFTPRERDQQRHEVIIDNDSPIRGTRYIEVDGRHQWSQAPRPGFAMHTGHYTDGENPFVAGTARMAKATGSKKRYSMVSYQPDFPADGEYAVYVSYQTLDNSVDDASYTVWHKGEPTEIRVNQRMGGGTWVYIGTFHFDQGSSEFNRVVLTNQSSGRGVVTTDAVRFGGGMGNIERGGSTSRLPRAMEGARYYAQWAGMPRSVYGAKGGTDDYRDDINTRSLMVNHLAGGSVYMPSTDGLGVPIELSLAIHSDAGYSHDLTQTIGSLGICTTNFNGGRLDAGISRLASRDLAMALLDGVQRDITYKFGHWNTRGLRDRNYSETRLPGVPSAILETMSHQNFPDMRLGQDPNFKFTLARSIYKTLLRYITAQHGEQYCVTPLAPRDFCVEVGEGGLGILRWQPSIDPQEPTAYPTAYIVYTRRGEADFDNGTLVRGATSMGISLDPGVLYSFRVVALTRGGKSLPTEELCAMYHPGATRTALIVNGFHRLSSPAVRNNAKEQGFDHDEDPGVSLGSTCAWVGRQERFDTKRIGIESETGLGWTNDDFLGMFIAGNERCYVRCHAEAMSPDATCNIASCSSSVVESGGVNLSQYAMVDLVLGLEKDDGHSLITYKAFSQAMQRQLAAYAAQGGALMVSGAYVGSDMQTSAERQFLSDVLRCQQMGTSRVAQGTITGMNTTMQIHANINEQHYAATTTDVLSPVAPAFTALVYPDGQSAGVAANQGTHRSFTFGFPFECLKDSHKRTSIMQGIMRFLMD